jgi:Fur family transcriptional regulator, ferric uptake regulator
MGTAIICGVTWAERTHDALRREGHRRGAAREAVVSVLSGQDCVATVPEILAAAEAAGRPVGIASVYRVLDLLTDKGLVQRIDLGGGRSHYERIDGEEHHHHVVCDECGRVEPFSDEKLEAALHRVEQQTGYTVSAHDVLLRGACVDCR